MADSTLILDAATATNGIPSLATDGYGRLADKAAIQVYSTAGSATMTVTIKLWGYSAVSGKWSPLGIGTAASPDSAKGILNGGNAIGETSTDAISHLELLEGLNSVARIYAEITAIGGTSTAISAYLLWDN